MLIDYLSWSEKKGIKYSTFSTHQVRLQDIIEIAKENNITFQKGDILFVRIGVTKEWDTIMTEAQRENIPTTPDPSMQELKLPRMSSAGSGIPVFRQLQVMLSAGR